MNNANSPVQCRACKRTTRMDQVRYDDTRKAYVCPSCYLETHKTGSKPTTQQAPPTKTASSTGPKIKYACPKCKYKWEKSADKTVGKCPYCGNSNVEKVSNEASKIIDDADRYDF